MVRGDTGDGGLLRIQDKMSAELNQDDMIWLNLFLVSFSKRAGRDCIKYSIHFRLVMGCVDVMTHFCI